MSNTFSPTIGVNQPSIPENKLSLAIKSALLSSSLALLPATAYAANVTENINSSTVELSSTQIATITFSIKAAKLDTVLKQFAKNAGINLSYEADAISKVNSKGLSGRYTIDAGLQEILVGSGFKATKTANGYSLSASNDSHIATLATAIVQGDSIKDGSSEDGYINGGNTSIGIWQNRTLQETPYSINVVSNDLIENLQATSTDQIFKINPLTKLWVSQAYNDTSFVFMRGFKSARSSRNGLTRDSWDYGNSMADVERVEVLTGVSGFLYGRGSVGGMVNYVTKKPTEERLNSITLGNTSGSNMYLQGDFGGQIDSDGMFGYRFNVLTQEGTTAVEHQDAERDFISLVLDWQATDDLLLEVEGSHRTFQMNGRQATWQLETNDDSITGQAIRPDANDIDSDKLWAQQWSTQKTTAERFGANIKWQLADNMLLRSAYQHEVIGATGANVDNTLNVNGTYSQGGYSQNSAPRTHQTEAMYAYFDIDFSTGNIEHTLTAGVRHRIGEYKHFDNWRSDYVETVTNASLLEPVYVNEPQWSEHGQGNPYVKEDYRVTSYSIGDDIRFNEQWSALIGINKTRILDKYYESTGEVIADWTEDNDAITPTLSLLYQATETINTYVTYMEALEKGGYVEDDMYLGREVINYDATLDPAISKQLELGAKMQWDGMLLTAALFEIDKVLEYYTLINNDEQAEFVQDGRQVHRGLEFTATGKLTDNLTLVGGFTLLDAEVKKQEQNPWMEGKTPAVVAEEMFKLYGEYQLSSVPELVLNAGFSYTGSSYGQLLDEKYQQEQLDAYTLVDIGARYQLDIANTPITFRFNISNLTDERYWISGSMLGDGRRASLSANVSF